ncbi:MAG: hypothetical protein QOK29_2900 [Rhodospirillaceae bacterium]|nr:hypothetical protein [Rhodospirillaceae bacterium]
MSQWQALGSVLRHAAVFSPYYRDQEWAARLRSGAAINFPRDVPLTSKSVVRGNSSAFYSLHIPDEHGSVVEEFTSGSTGAPVMVKKTKRHLQVNAIELHRLIAGWRLEDHKNALNLAPDTHKSAGSCEMTHMPNGARMFTLHGLEASAALNMLLRSGASAISGYPSLIHEVLKLGTERSVNLPLKLISTKGEVASDEFRGFAADHSGCQILDRYGSMETGVIATSCKLCNHYHMADRHLLVEVLRADGTPAARGEIGRMVVTPLYNLAMPLVRYDIGDYVELSGDEACEKKPSFSIRRIFGREVNIFKLADGTRVTPRLPADALAALGVRQYKLVQTTLHDVELRYIPENESTQVSDEWAQRLVERHIAPILRAKAIRTTDLPRRSGGKYLMHESLV